MTKRISNNEILLDYVKKEIIKLGFVKILNTEDKFVFGKSKPHTEIYHISVTKLDFLVNTYEVELTVSKTDILSNTYFRTTLKSLYLTNIITNQTYDDKVIKTSEFLNYISKIDKIRNKLLVRKLKKINEKL